MTARLTSYAAPPRPSTQEGAERRVGVEVEFANLDVRGAVEVTKTVLGGTVEHLSRTEGRVICPPYGTFKVELDAPAALKDRSYLKPFERLGMDADTAMRVEKSVVRVARTLVPVELVTPPIAWSKLREIDRLWARLSLAGAEGTSEAMFYAFGLHLNPEPPDLTVETVCNVMRSFVILEDWLFEHAEVDLARRVGPHIQPFPEPYRRLILSADYAPDWESFAEDYVEHNPTRNRPLDLLPMFSHLSLGDYADQIENWHLVKARPTYHFRLPNSEVSDASFTPAASWNRWVVVERLSENRELLDLLAREYLATADLPWRLQSMAWKHHIAPYMGSLLSGLEF